MFSRFRKEGRSELLKGQPRDAISVPEEERKESDAVDASTTSVASTMVNGPSAEACPVMPEPEDADQATLPSQVCDIASEQPAAVVASELPVIERYRGYDIPKFFRGDAAFANPALYRLLEKAGYGYAIRIKSNAVLEREIEHLLTRPVGRPSHKPKVFYHSFRYQAKS